MQPAGTATVLGHFDGSMVTYAGTTSTLFRRDGRFLARTDGPDGALQEYEVTHTFGVSPLQQYLVRFPAGRLQALEIAWDSRPRAQGGQRWFHLYPGERVTSGDPLHWTGPTENWNFMCADCHSTHVRKSYDARTATYATAYSEMSVSCEACHGPGSTHLAWARGETDGGLPRPAMGLSIALDERKGVAWIRDATTGKPRRNTPRGSDREIEMCARCHARRALIHEDYVHGQPLGDDYRVALLDDDLYYPDGQIKGEAYEYGSFVQSRMYAEGVTCSDCHDPHRPELRAATELVCLQCHSQEAYFTPKHHFHRQGSAGSRCVSCHMPATTYMVVDPRRDHSLRVPRPDLSVKLGVPNPCTGCHTDRPATWAARTVQKWYGHTPTGRQRFAEALAAGAAGAPGAEPLLVRLVADRGQPAIARASAIALLERGPTPAGMGAARGSLDDPDALVRRSAVHALAGVEGPVPASLLERPLADPVRVVRMEAALALAGMPPDLLSPGARSARMRARDDFAAAQELNAERPEAHFDLGLLVAQEGQFDRAEAELNTALSIDPAFAPAAVNLADLYRTQGRDQDAEALLRDTLKRAPGNPPLLHALGLVLVRQKRLAEATTVLGAAARLGPENPRYGYIHAVALESEGHRGQALAQLQSVLARHPYHRDTLTALVTLLRRAGDLDGAVPYVRRLATLDDGEEVAR
jgi:Flp pilus assembly protein TadD